MNASKKDNAKPEPLLIKKYPNRRLYDTEISRYITLDEVRDLTAMDVSPWETG